MSKRPNVLVVEDDAAIRKMIAHALSEFADVTDAEDGAAGLLALRGMTRYPDLLITDLMMPKVDGLTMLKQIRADPAGKAMPVIILTAKTRPMDVVTGINAGARHYLTKPFQRDDLIAKAKSILRVS